VKKIHVVVNPCAANSLAGKRWPHILKHLTKNGFAVVSHLTERKFHAYHLAKNFVEQGAELIVSVGGDGTFNEVVNGILNSTKQLSSLPELAIIPIGTGLDLVKTLNIRGDYESAIDIIKSGITRFMDIGRITFSDGRRVGVRYFANVFDFGLGGNVVRIANIIPKVFGGYFTFLLATLIVLIIFKRIKLKIWVDKNSIGEELVTIIGTANGQFFGGGMHIAPMASIDDGFLEVLYVKDTNVFKFISNVLFKIYDARHLEYRNVCHHRIKDLKIKSEKICILDIDGEEEKAREIVVSVIPKAIKIRVPNIH